MMEMNFKNLSDLHVHLDGSISFDTARKLAKMQGMDVKSDVELSRAMVVSKNCRDLNEYLMKFDYPLSLLQTKEAITLSVYELLCKQRKHGIVYSEIRFAPQLHKQKGLSQEQVVLAAINGLQRFEDEVRNDITPMTSGLILCCMRGNDNVNENFETVEVAKAFLNRGVCAIDLAGAEGLYPTKDFEEIFKRASSKNIPFTIHAGEADGPESIWKAIEFGAKRIGHGIRCIEDKELMHRLAKDQIALELCPTSNLNTKVFKDITEYPMKQLLDAGICATINTDNMTVSDVTVESELNLIANTFGFSNEEMNEIIENSHFGAFYK